MRRARRGRVVRRVSVGREAEIMAPASLRPPVGATFQIPQPQSPQPCDAFIRRRVRCSSAALWRVVLACPTCALDGIRLMCQRHMTEATAGRIVCHACWNLSKQLVFVRIAAVEPL